MLETVVGNHATKQTLQTALAQNHLPHSILLCGEKGCGAGYVARCLAADFLTAQGNTNPQAVMENRSTECIVLAGEGVKGEIKAESARAVRREIYNTGLSCDGRVVIIKDADHLNASSANILLKVLEEPPQNVLFILTAPSSANILGTIRSRCAQFTLAPPTAQECITHLQALYPRAKNTQRLCAIFDNKIGAVIEVLENRASNNVLTDADALQGYLLANQAYEAMVLLAKYEKEKPKTVQLLQYTIALLRLAMREENLQGAPQAIRAVDDAIRQLTLFSSPLKLTLTNMVATLCIAG